MEKGTYFQRQQEFLKQRHAAQMASAAPLMIAPGSGRGRPLTGTGRGQPLNLLPQDLTPVTPTLATEQLGVDAPAHTNDEVLLEESLVTASAAVAMGIPVSSSAEHPDNKMGPHLEKIQAPVINTENLVRRIFAHMDSPNVSINAINGLWMTYRGYLEGVKNMSYIESFKKLLIMQREHIQGKVVMDLGCGIGILSLMCATMGAETIIAVDSSPFSVVLTELAEANNLDDKISVVVVPLEDLRILPRDLGYVDTIVSDWMGFGFFRGNLLREVVTARDTWMRKPKIIPRIAELYICAVSDDSYHRTYKCWKNVDNVDFGPLREADLATPILGDLAQPLAICSSRAKLQVYDAEVIAAENIGFTAEFCLHAANFPRGRLVPVTAFVVYFECPSPLSNDVMLSTDPSKPRIKHGQATFCLPSPCEMTEDSELNGRFTYLPLEKSDPVFIVEFAVDDYDVQTSCYGTYDDPSTDP